MSLHRTAATGYDRAAAAYARGRPAYPAPVVAWLGDRLGTAAGSTLVELGAGSGQLTHLVAPTVGRMVAVEPVEAMARRLLALPGVAVLGATASDIPLRGRSAGALAVANAFHWFATDETLAEMRRVLAPEGRVGLVWNRRDRSQPLQRALMALVEPYRDAEPSYLSMAWRQVVDASPLFSVAETATFENPHVTDVDGVVAHVSSTSFVAALGLAERNDVLSRAEELARAEPEPVTLRYLTDAYVLVPDGPP